MNEQAAQILKTGLPVIGFFLLAFLGWFIKLNMDRVRYAKKSENQVLIMIQPKAGKFVNFLRPIEMVGGIQLVKIPNVKNKITETSPTHILGEAGEFPCDYPIGKYKFVQATVQALYYYEGDAEPLSNITDRPIVSGQLITNLIDGVGTSATEAMKKSQEESNGALKKGNPLLWVFVLLVLSVGVGIAGIVVMAKNTQMLPAMYQLLQQAFGVK